MGLLLGFAIFGIIVSICCAERIRDEVTGNEDPSLLQTISSGRYSIFTRVSDLALDVNGYSQSNGAHILQYGDNGQLNQRFDVVDLENGHWAILPAHSVVKSLDVTGRSTSEGAQIQQYHYVSESQQFWDITPVGSGFYRIVSVRSGLSLTIEGSNPGAGARLKQFNYANNHSQHFRFVDRPPAHDFNNLVWSDEFNYEGLPSESSWSYETGMIRNNEAQYYVSRRLANTNVSGGVLTISARQEDWGDAQFTSSSILTMNKRSWRYGRFEMRGRFDTGLGLWPAFWALGPGKWPEGGELDIMEYYQSKLLANAAWKDGSSDEWSASWNSMERSLTRLRYQHPDWDSRFHVWRMDWDYDSIRFYVDGLPMNVVDLDTTVNPDGSNPFRSGNFYVLLNLAVGGNQGGNPWGTSFPATFEVDYVRVYK